jgi:hypothetical protein
MRGFLITIIAPAIWLLSTPTLACIAEAPPPWEQLLANGGPAVVIGRVVEVRRAPEPRSNGSFEMWDDTATIHSIDAVRGEPAATYAVTAVGDFTRLRDGPTFCADRMTLVPGDIVLGYERPNGTLRVVEPHQVPDFLRVRVEAAHDPEH